MELHSCDECGTDFVPRREHARFCSRRCRVAWNRQRSGDPAVALSALSWSLTAMTATTGRLGEHRVWGRAGALRAIDEAVWRVTIADAALLRSYPSVYDDVLGSHAPDERRSIEQTLSGLRFVRNGVRDELDIALFVRSPAGEPDVCVAALTTWGWNPVPEPSTVGLAPVGRTWALSRYRAYQAQLAGHSIGEIFTRAAGFLETAAATAPDPVREVGARSPR
jgi:hypothetical protein